jgi:hypothetical protein
MESVKLTKFAAFFAWTIWIQIAFECIWHLIEKNVPHVIWVGFDILRACARITGQDILESGHEHEKSRLISP